ncbi:MAG: GNAT family N-acetyltransferase [Nitrospiraceae bacterium]|nr:GNAT family N-acetyltransferase [Nitrospiraceae bacterium]
MNADFINPDDARWPEVLRSMKHDCYHLPEYAEVAALEDGVKAMAFYAEKGSSACLIPLLLRPLSRELNAPPDWFDCASPYGYPGILSSSPDELHPFLDAFTSRARAHGIVSAFIRLHPLLHLDYGALEKFGTLVTHGQTVFIDLSEPNDRIWQQMSTNHRRNITRLLRTGFRCSVDDWSRYEDYIEVYHATMQRVEAARGYFFSMRYFKALRERLGDCLHLVCVLSDDNELAAAGLFMATEGIVQYHLGGTAEKYLAVAPSKLMLDFVWRWAQEQGHDVFHLGGGLGGVEDSLFQFKAGFSPLRGQFHTYRMVVDESKYAALDQAARSLRGPDDSSAGDFFPIYRRLVGSAA